MTKDELLQLLKLLSALEGWSFAEKSRPPDYLIEGIDAAVEILEREIKK